MATALVCLYAIIAGGCQQATRPAEPLPQGYSPWDTTLEFHGVNPLTRAAMARALVSPGEDGRLPAFLRKCRRGGEVRVGFLGGSVTAGAGAGDPSRRYATLFCAFLGRIFPQAQIVEVNAGIGGTDSRFGASRVREDLLVHRPDLIVLEYAVNDDPAQPGLYKPAFEGVIRQCLADTGAAVLLYFTLNNAGSPLGEDPKIEIGRHYGLPMVSLLRAAWPLAQSGSIPIESLLVDLVHPRDLGHFIGAYTLFSALRQATLADARAPIRPVAPPLFGTLYDTAGLLETGSDCIAVSDSGGWEMTLKEQGRIGMRSPRPGRSLKLGFRGKELTLGYRATAAGNALLQVVVNGRAVDTLSDHFEGDWGGGVMRLKQVILADAPGEISIRLRLLAGSDFKVDYVMYAGPDPRL